MELFTGKKSQEVVEYLLRRRSPKGIDAKAPGPAAEELETILTAAARVPDHGRTVPFYFVVFEGDARGAAGNVFAEAFQKRNPDASEDKVQSEREKFFYAPVVVMVVHRARKAKHPLWEQVLTCGAVCENLIMASHAMGYGAHWLTGWAAYDDDVRAAFGLDERDSIAGFIHIGAPAGQAEERARPDMEQIVTRWEPGENLRKGDGYDNGKFGIPGAGVRIFSR